MHLGVFVLGTGNHSAGWRWEGAAASNNDLAVIQEIARIAERGKFDLLFISDGLDYGARGSSVVYLPLRADELISVLSAAHDAARPRRHRIDELYANRTTSPASSPRSTTSARAAPPGTSSPARRPKAALNFSRDRSHGPRIALRSAPRNSSMSSRGCGIAGRTARSSPTRRPAVYIDDSKIRPLDHKGRFFQVKGPMNMARCPQGHPVIIQAGGSPSGLELAARTADVVFSVVQELDSAKKAYADLKGRMAKYGRAPDATRRTARRHADHRPSEAEAQDKLELQSWLTPTNAADAGDQPDRLRCLRLPARRAGTAAAAPSEGGRTFTACSTRWRGGENMTLRDLYNLTAAARGHWVICGTRRIADTLEEWFVEGAADGYNILPAYFPGAFADFVDLVVPELQRRGLFRRDYEGTTLRDHFGLRRLTRGFPFRPRARRSARLENKAARRSLSISLFFHARHHDGSARADLRLRTGRRRVIQADLVRSRHRGRQRHANPVRRDRYSVMPQIRGGVLRAGRNHDEPVHRAVAQRAGIGIDRHEIAGAHRDLHRHDHSFLRRRLGSAVLTGRAGASCAMTATPGFVGSGFRTVRVTCAGLSRARPENVSRMLRAAGPRRTMNSVGRMNRIIGTVSIAGSRAAFSSARVMRASRNSAARMRSDWASGVPNLAVCSSVFTTPRIDGHVGAGVQILERHPALGQIGQLGGGDAEFLAQLGPGQFQLARHAHQRSVEAEPRFGADHQQVERIRQAQLHLVRAFL